MSEANQQQAKSAEKKQGQRGRGGGSAKLRGLPTDSPKVRMSKTLSWVLRHGSQAEGLAMRPDGYVRVDDLLKIPKMHEADFERIQEMVKKDAKSRFHLNSENEDGGEVWWIRANQGHSMQEVKLELQPIQSVSDIPTGIAVHGTTRKAWEIIREQGLSKMARNHIHLAQGVPGSGVISGMRQSSHVLIYIDVQKALDAGVKFSLSSNGVVLTEGDERGFLSPEYFARVETVKGEALLGWDHTAAIPRNPVQQSKKKAGKAKVAATATDESTIVA